MKGRQPCVILLGSERYSWGLAPGQPSEARSPALSSWEEGCKGTGQGKAMQSICFLGDAKQRSLLAEALYSVGVWRRAHTRSPEVEIGFLKGLLPLGVHITHSAVRKEEAGLRRAHTPCLETQQVWSSGKI